MDNKRFTSEELLALQAVFRGCNTNKRIQGAMYVQNFGTTHEREISYFDALKIVGEIIKEEIQKYECEECSGIKGSEKQC